MSEIFDVSKIQLKWVGISIIIFIIAQTILAVVFALANVLTIGVLGMLLGWALPLIVYFITGFITGIVSPGITIFEPAVGAGLTVTIASIIGLNGKQNFVSTILLAVLAFVLALVGAYIGEKRQLKNSKKAH